MIIITGGSGFIGSHLASFLVEKGYKVQIIDIVPPPLGINAEFIRASILDMQKLLRLFSNAQAIVHLAALVDVQASISDPYSDFQVNVQGTINVLEAAKKNNVKKVIFSSSAAVYGEPKEFPISEEHPTNPISPYGLSKLCSEKYVLLYNKLYGMENIALRFFNVYGKGQNTFSPYSGVITKFAEKLKEGKEPLIYGDGKQTRDFVHVKDVCQAIYLSLSAKADEPINIGSGKETSIIELLEKMCFILNTKPNPKFLSPKKGDIKRSFANIQKAKDLLGFSPKITLEEGLKEILL